MAPVSSHLILDKAAAAIAAEHADSLPRLDKFIVLLPHHHAIPEFIRCLAKHAAVEHLVLPHITTLSDLASGYSSDQIEIPNSKRQSLIYRLLKEKGWFDTSDLWHLSAELIGLFDELTEYSIRLPESEQTFITQLEEIYKIRGNGFLQFEARLIHELWYAMVSDQNEIDPIIAYHKKLKNILQNVDCPLYVIGYSKVSPAEQDFFKAYSEKRVIRFFPESGDLAVTPLSSLLDSVWPEHTDAEFLPLGDRATKFAKQYSSSPVVDKVFLFPAYGLEQEARAADLIIRRWLNEGKRKIAVIVEDRLIARRARALLERSQILVDDETGWKLSTTSASTAIARWLDVIADDFYYESLLDLLKSPFVFTDIEISKRKIFVYQLESYIRSNNIINGLDHYRGVLKAAEGFEGIFRRLQEAANCFNVKRLTLFQWSQRLVQSMQLLNIDQSFKYDLAGDQLLNLLKMLMLELESDQTNLSFSEWRSWLNQQFEAGTFRDKSIESPVVFTNLSAAQLRHFDGTLLVGADANHLSNLIGVTRFFNQEIRAQVGLPTAQSKLKQLCDNLAGMFLNSDTVYITWQATKDGEPNLLSPYFQRLSSWHHLAYGTDLVDNDLSHLLNTSLDQDQPDSTFPSLAQRPQPRVAADLVPQSVSASAYNSLVACPYQFYARHMLGLNQIDEVQEEIDKRHYGELIHRILFKFHQRYASITGCDRIELLNALTQISNKEFAEVLELNYLSLSWRLRWEVLFNTYLDWQLERENQGWRWYGGEQKYELEVPLINGNTVKLNGRIDRIDVKTENDVQQYSVIDYKTKNSRGLKDRLLSVGEDVQLPVYTLLFDKAVSEAAYLSLDKEKPILVKLEENLGELSEQIKIRLQDLLNQIYQQSPLPAQGIEQGCRYCEMRGLCRKDYWSGR